VSGVADPMVPGEGERFTRMLIAVTESIERSGYPELDVAAVLRLRQVLRNFLYEEGLDVPITRHRPTSGVGL